MKQRLEAALGIKAINIYALSEITGLGVGVEDPADSDSLILWNDHFYSEVVNKERGGGA